MRETIYRGQSVKTGEWVFGCYQRFVCHGVMKHYIIPSSAIVCDDVKLLDALIEVDEKTVGEFSSIKDKSGEMIFEGDIILFYGYKRYTQQSFADCSPEIDELTIKKNIEEVIFEDGCFITRSDSGLPFIERLSTLGLFDVESVKDNIFGESRKDYYDEEEMICDMNGVMINDSIIGVEIIGNIHNNPELIKK